MEQKNKEIDLYNEKVVARGKVGGCYAFDKENISSAQTVKNTRALKQETP